MDKSNDKEIESHIDGPKELDKSNDQEIESHADGPLRHGQKQCQSDRNKKKSTGTSTNVSKE